MRITMNNSWASLKDWLSAEPKKSDDTALLWDIQHWDICMYPSDYFDQAYRSMWVDPCHYISWGPFMSIIWDRIAWVAEKKIEKYFSLHFYCRICVCTHVWANFQICYHSLVQMVTHRICMWSKRIKVINFIKWNDENIRFALNFIHKASIYCGERMKNFRTQMWTLLHTAQMNRCHYNAWQLRYHLPAIQQTLLKQ